MTKQDLDEWTLAHIGMCLLCVQQAEKALTGVVESVFDRPKSPIAEQSLREKKKTLGEVLKELKLSTKIEHGIKEKLFNFLEMRNTLVHNLSDVPDWNLKTESGKRAAKKFLAELSLTALGVTALCATIFSVSAKDDYGVDLFFDDEEEKRKLLGLLETKLGSTARNMLSGRYYRPKAIGRSTKKPSKSI